MGEEHVSPLTFTPTTLVLNHHVRAPPSVHYSQLWHFVSAVSHFLNSMELILALSPSRLPSIPAGTPQGDSIHHPSTITYHLLTGVSEQGVLNKSRIHFQELDLKLLCLCVCMCLHLWDLVYHTNQCVFYSLDTVFNTFKLACPHIYIHKYTHMHIHTLTIAIPTVLVT